MRRVLLLSIFFIYSYALTPYSLESLKEVNVKVLNKKDTISKTLEQKIQNKLILELENLGIKSSTDSYSNFLVKIKIDKFSDTVFVRTAIIISEDVKPLRDENIEILAITYIKEDSFEAEDLENEIYESVIKYLLSDFKEQYKQENKELQ